MVKKENAGTYPERGEKVVDLLYHILNELN